MTVSELAHYLHVNPVWASRKAMAGELPAFKVGNRWRFVREEIDLWIQQRKKVKEVTYPKNLTTFLQRVTQQYQEQLCSVILYGSYARGEQTKESDVDLVCVVQQRLAPLSNAISDLTYQIMLEEGFDPLLSVLVMDERDIKKLHQQQSPLIQEISKEGNFLWKRDTITGKGY